MLPPPFDYEASQPFSNKTLLRQVRGLLDLPTELIIDIIQYLPASSLMLLRRICHRLRELPEVEGMPKDLSREELSMLQRGLDRDGCFTRRRFCIVCERLHGLDCFTRTELCLPERVCLLHQGVLWIKQDTILTLEMSWKEDQPTEEEKWHIEAGLSREAVYTSIDEGGSGQEYCSNNGLDVHIHPPEAQENQLCSFDLFDKAFLLLPLSPIDWPSLTDISSVLEKLQNLPICPHLSFNDPRLLHNFDVSSSRGPISSVFRPGCYGEMIECCFCPTVAQIIKVPDQGQIHLLKVPGLYIQVRHQFPVLVQSSPDCLLAASIVSPDEDLQRHWNELHTWRIDLCRAYLEAQVAKGIALAAAGDLMTKARYMVTGFLRSE